MTAHEKQQTDGRPNRRAKCESLRGRREPKGKASEISFPNAIRLLEQNPDKINWSRLSGNPNAMHLLEANPGKLSNQIFINPSIFTPDL